MIRGKTRRFTVPKDELLISVHARLLEHFYPLNEALHPCCVAYVPGRRPMDAAAPHVGGRWIQKLDIADFFPSTSSERVRVTFEMLGASFEVAAALADLTTYNNSLPTGARTSPFLSNLVLADFDYAIAAASESLGVTYSRYADDMIFSANEAFDMTQLVSQKLATLGYKLNLRKTRVRRRGQPLRVAGLTVFEMEGPRLPKRTKKRLRLELFLLGKALAAAQLIELDEDAESELAVRTASTRGLVRYCQSVERDWTDRLVSRFPEASEVIARRTDPNRREAAVAAMVAQIRSTPAPRLTAHWEYIGDPPRMDD